MVSEAFRLEGKTALVAGDNAFWNAAVAAALAEAGADVAVAAGNSRKVTEAVDAVLGLGRKAIAVPTDMTSSAELEKMAEQVVAEFGNIDILVNTTDIPFAKPFVETTEEEWQKCMDGNLTPVVRCCRVVGKQMLQQKKGRIINVTSCLAERAIENSAAYCTAMGGVLQLTRALDLEWAGQGITVNAVGAGWFSDTEKTGAPQETPLLKYLPMKRYGRPEEVGSMVVYLASDAADFYSGQFLHVDGAVMSHL